MAVNLSPVFGVAAQLFNDNGDPLAGGKIYTYAAGTTTNATTYTNTSGAIAHSNPIVLDGAGRVPSGEIWLTDGISYKFVVKDSSDALIGTYDNLVGINSNFVNFTAQQEIQTATAGQTVFTLTTMQYQPGTNSLAVFVDGVNQYGPGASYAYVETNATTVTFTTGLHVGADVKFTTTSLTTGNATSADVVSYTPPFPGGVTTNVEFKLAQTISVKDFGAVGDGVTDDTAAIQAAIEYASDGGELWFPKGSYSISEIYFNKTYQTIWFDNAQLVANSSATLEAAVHIVRRQCTFYNLFVSGNYKANYTSAIKWYADGSGNYPGYVKLYNVQVNDAVIGIMYGQGTLPVDAPVSENSIIGYTTRGVIKPIYTNQPNGFLFMTNCVLDCQKYEWDIYNPGVFRYADAVCVQNHQCVLSISNSEFVKAASSDGYGVINRSVLTLNAVTAEIAAPNFFVGNPVSGSLYGYSELHINGYHSHFFNNATNAFIECESGANKIFATDLKYFKGAGASGAGKGLINTGSSSQIIGRFNNCHFVNQVASALMAVDTSKYYTLSDIRITDSYIEDSANSYNVGISMSNDNAASYYQFQDITKYDLVPGGPNATASIVASGAANFANALELTSTDSTPITAATKIGIDGSIRMTQRMAAVEFSMKVLAGTVQFYGSVAALYYDDGGNYLGVQDLGANGEIGPFTSIAGAQEYVTVRRTLTPPLNAAQVSLRFGISNYAQTWRIGNIKVY